MNMLEINSFKDVREGGGLGEGGGGSGGGGCCSGGSSVQWFL